MKKEYIVPESKLFAINMSENIAISGGSSEISGSAVIKFTHTIDGCKQYYTGDTTAPVKVTSGMFGDYVLELRGYNNMNAYFNCYTYTFG